MNEPASFPRLAPAPSALPHLRDQLFPEYLLETQDGVFSYRECGSGENTVVLLHGIGSGAGSWYECANSLGKQARVIAWNAPGYGGSTPLLPEAPLASHYARHLHQLLSGLGIGRPVLVGHSLGALMAAAYASLFGDALQGLLLFSPALGYGACGQEARAQQVRQQRFTHLHTKGIDGMAQALPDRLLSAGASAANKAEVQYNASRITPQGYAQAIQLLCGDTITHYPVPSHTPVYCGELDIVTTPEQSAAYAQASGLPFSLIKNAGHACYVEQPGQVANAICQVLASAGQ